MSPIRQASRGQSRPGAAASSRTPRAKKSLRARRKSAVLAMLAMLSLCSTGCSVVHNGFTAVTKNGSWNDTVIVLRNRSLSAKAWHRRKHHYCREKYNQDFCNGFRAGYEAVASGSNGCTPAFAPSEYWSWEYQSAEGQSRTAAWFAGFPHGARAAEEEGVANWNQIAMSAGMQSQFQDAGILTHEGALYPIPDGSTPVSPTTVPYSVPMADGSLVPMNAFQLNEGEVLLKADPLPPNVQMPQPIQP